MEPTPSFPGTVTEEVRDNVASTVVDTRDEAVSLGIDLVLEQPSSPSHGNSFNPKKKKEKKVDSHRRMSNRTRERKKKRESSTDPLPCLDSPQQMECAPLLRATFSWSPRPSCSTNDGPSAGFHIEKR